MFSVNSRFNDRKKEKGSFVSLSRIHFKRHADGELYVQQTLMCRLNTNAISRYSFKIH